MADRGKEGSAPVVRTVALIGAGAMGAPIAHHIRRAGLGLTVCDNRPEALAGFAAAGVRTTRSPADCAACDAIFVLVATAAQLEAVATGPNGILSGVTDDRPRYLVVGSTVAPDDVEALAQSFAGTCVRVVDAPVSGGVVGARRGTLTVLAGGTGQDVEALRPLFASMGKVLHCGPVGAGLKTKAVNNIIAITNLLISAEAFRIAAANGLRFDDLIPALEAGSARNFLTVDADYAREVYAAWSGSEAEYEAVNEIGRKDLKLALKLGEGLDLPTLNAILKVKSEIGDETLANWRAVARGDGD
jgi:3-hydroxyisobutyrate dehydrogenase-like beta-hydroxyacid dehydrogenase